MGKNKHMEPEYEIEEKWLSYWKLYNIENIEIFPDSSESVPFRKSFKDA